MLDAKNWGEHWVYFSTCCQNYTDVKNNYKITCGCLHGPPSWSVLNCTPEVKLANVTKPASVYLHGCSIPCKDFVGVLGPHLPEPEKPEQVELEGWNNSHYTTNTKWVDNHD